jgi:DHA1 family multidrug resistance protein-like MFS transporter
MANIPDEEKSEHPLGTPNDSSDELNTSQLITWNLPYDPDNPQQWSSSRRWVVTYALGGMTLVVSFASSVFSTATRATAEEFHVSTEVTTLGTSLYILVSLRTTAN